MISTIGFLAAEVDTDDKGYITANPFMPARAEWMYGGVAFLIIAGLLWKYALPAFMKSQAARTDRIQGELDDAAAAKAAATTEAASIREAKGDIDAERQRLLADADLAAAAAIEDGRARLNQELADLEARSIADIATATGRVGDELRSEIARLSTAAVDHVVTGSLDDATHQELIESFISRVGAAR